MAGATVPDVAADADDDVLWATWMQGSVGAVIVAVARDPGHGLSSLSISTTRDAPGRGGDLYGDATPSLV